MEQNKASDAKAIMPPSTGRPMPSQFLRKRWLASINPLFSLLLLTMKLYVWNISLVILGHLLSCVPSQPIAHLPID